MTLTGIRDLRAQMKGPTYRDCMSKDLASQRKIRTHRDLRQLEIPTTAPRTPEQGIADAFEFLLARSHAMAPCPRT